MDLDFTQIIAALINGIFGGGFALAVWNAYRVRRAKRAGVSGIEQVATVQTMPSKIMDPLTAYLRAELRRAHAQAERYEERIDQLEEHIWLQLPPPPPARRAPRKDPKQG